MPYKILITFLFLLNTLLSFADDLSTNELLKRLIAHESLDEKDKKLGVYFKELTNRLDIEGFIRPGEKYRFDYSDYYLFEKDYKFLNTPILAIEHEYMDKWVGCCVNPGFALFLMLEKKTTELERFTSDNKCSLSLSTERTNDLKTVFKRLKKIMKVKEGNIYYLDCKQNVRKKILKL
ncbi:MAG: hypothetical protein K9K67_08935 [Bacteriovoracaceae bacterium]|nr:hypothetical protein [Bacteriovoracaceae bacterium]